jgi:hypothetical protein
MLCPYGVIAIVSFRRKCVIGRGVTLKKPACHCERQFSELLSEAVPLPAGRLLRRAKNALLAMTGFFLIEVREALWSYSQ